MEYKKLAFILIFTFLVFISVYVPISRIAETSKYFTLYEFFGPLPAAFLGPLYGAIVVIVARAITIFTATPEIGIFDIARIFTMVFATWYFANYKKDKYLLIVPVIAMAMFIAHPAGQEAWVYSLYWLIPIVAYLLPNNLFFRSLGATFMAHAVGSIAFLYTFQTTPAYWLALIPIVAVERAIFASGVAISFIAVTTVLNKFFTDDKSINIEKGYVISSFALKKKI
ncbi:MAG: hypothetical protein QW255_02515 [Candidatus Bilamarchaeaceae archaeon]